MPKKSRLEHSDRNRVGEGLAAALQRRGFTSLSQWEARGRRARRGVTDADVARARFFALMLRDHA